MDHPVPITSHDHTAALPTELLLYVFSHFTFEELHALLAVSTRWRAAALDCPAYWSFIHLKGLTDGAVNLFVTRLSWAGSRPVALIINLRGPDLAPSLLLMKAVTTLREHVAHLESLVVSLHTTDAEVLWNSMNCAAPQLRYLFFDVHPRRTGEGWLTGETLPVVPSNLFLGSTPHLATIILSNIDFPLHPVPAFAKASIAILRYTVHDIMPDFFAHFPSATTVDFPDAFYKNPIYQVASSYEHIKHCIMRTSDHLHNARVPLAALRDLEYVHIYQPHPAEIARAVDHIPSPLSLVVSPDLDNPDDDFEIAIADSHKRLARWRFIIDQTARWSREHHPESTLRDALHAALAGKVFDLYADAAYWPTLVHVLPPIAGLQVVQLQVSRDDDLTALSPAAFASGSLHMLSLTSKACLVVSANKLVAFASGSFGAHVPRLALANIHLEGDLGELRACFGEFEFMHGAPCGCLPPRSDSATGFIELLDRRCRGDGVHIGSTGPRQSVRPSPSAPVCHTERPPSM